MLLQTCDTPQNLSVVGLTWSGQYSPTAVEIKDEDDMVSDSATALATQQSIKAYVGTQVALRTNIYKSSETNIPADQYHTRMDSFAGPNSDRTSGNFPLICKTAEFGYSVGDEIDFTSMYTYNVGVQTFGQTARKSAIVRMSRRVNVFNIATDAVNQVVR